MHDFSLDQIPYSDELVCVKDIFNAKNIVKNTRTLSEREELHNKIAGSLEEAVRLCGLKDGMTISFHHHFRNGDYIVNLVMGKLAEMGFKHLVVAASSLTDCHYPLIEHIKSGVVRRIETSGLRGKLAEAVSIRRAWYGSCWMCKALISRPPSPCGTTAFTSRYPPPITPAPTTRARRSTSWTWWSFRPWVDCNYNVNVLTGSDGVIRGAIGGHPDTAYGASVSIIVVPLTRGRIPCIVKDVGTIVTPGKIVDVIVTEHGAAVNPMRKNLRKRILDSGLPLFEIEELQQKAEKLVGIPDTIPYTNKVVGVVTYRDGTVIDLIRQIKE